MKQRTDLIGGLNALDFALESQKLEAEQNRFVSTLLPLLDKVEQLCRGLETYSVEQLSERQEALSCLPDIADHICLTLDLERIGTVGNFADPEQYEVIETVADDSRPIGSIVEIIRCGWRFRGRTLRQSRVVATSKPGQN